MKKIMLFLLICLGIGSPKITTSQNPDVVIALQPIQALLKSILQQEAMDYDVYTKMEKYQKALKKVYEAQEVIKGLQTYIEVIKQIEAFACAIRDLDEMMNNGVFKIPFDSGVESIHTCLFNFKYKQILTGFSIANDMVEMTLSSLQMSASERVSVLKSGFKALNESFEGIQKLKKAIINFNR